MLFTLDASPKPHLAIAVNHYEDEGCDTRFTICIETINLGSGQVPPSFTEIMGETRPR